MKKKLLSLITVLLLSTSCNFNKNTPQTKVVVIKESDIIKKRIPVTGMTCVGCEVTLEETVSKINGVVSVKASHSKNEVVVEFDSTKTNTKTILNKIENSGYKPFK